MTALIAYVVVLLVTGAILSRVAPWSSPPLPPRPTWDMDAQSNKLQSVLSSLAGFAFTSVVLLITLSGGRLDVTSGLSIDLIALLVVAYLGFVVCAIMHASTEPLRTRGIALLPALHAVASTQFYRSVLSGWLALGPLIGIVGVTRLTTFILGVLVLAVFGGWLFHVANLRTLGFVDVRFGLASAALSAVGALAVAALVQLVPQLHTPDAVLHYVAVGALLGANAHFVFHAARALGDDMPPSLTRRARSIVAVDSHASNVLMTMLWFAVAGLL